MGAPNLQANQASTSRYLVTVKRRYAAPLSSLLKVSGDDCGVTHEVSACWQLRGDLKRLISRFSFWHGRFSRENFGRFSARGGAKFWSVRAIERACPTQRLLRGPPPHSGYCGSLADIAAKFRPCPRPYSPTTQLIEWVW